VEQPAEPAAKPASQSDPEQETLLADSVGLALLVVLERLAPAERLAFVLHDMFDLPFEEIASIVGRTPTATRQLASRARRRVRGGSVPAGSKLARQKKTVDAFLAALRTGDFEAVLAVLDPDFVATADTDAALAGALRETRGAENWARQAIKLARGAKLARVARINGEVGVVVAPHGRLFRVLRFTFAGNRIARVHVVSDPAHLAELDLAVLAD
jgi:hypothetical protein